MLRIEKRSESSKEELAPRAGSRHLTLYGDTICWPSAPDCARKRGAHKTPTFLPVTIHYVDRARRYSIA